jgi:hypothetical protein
LKDLPLGLRVFNLKTKSNFTYTSGRVWANNFFNLSIDPDTGTPWGGFTSGETDNLLIDIQPKYIFVSGSNTFRIKCSDTPKRSPASDAAFTALQTLIGPANVILN